MKIKRTISAPIDLELYETLEKIAKEEFVPKTILIRRALSKVYLNNETTTS